LVVDKCRCTKSRKKNLKSVLDLLYQHYVKNAEGSGGHWARVSNEDVNVSTSFESVSSNKKVKVKAALAIFHSF
jgi:hypothetical protein